MPKIAGFKLPLIVFIVILSMTNLFNFAISLKQLNTEPVNDEIESYGLPAVKISSHFFKENLSYAKLKDLTSNRAPLFFIMSSFFTGSSKYNISQARYLNFSLSIISLFVLWAILFHYTQDRIVSYALVTLYVSFFEFWQSATSVTPEGFLNFLWLFFLYSIINLRFLWVFLWGILLILTRETTLVLFSGLLLFSVFNYQILRSKFLLLTLLNLIFLYFYNIKNEQVISTYFSQDIVLELSSFWSNLYFYIDIVFVQTGLIWLFALYLILSYKNLSNYSKTTLLLFTSAAFLIIALSLFKWPLSRYAFIATTNLLIIYSDLALKNKSHVWILLIGVSLLSMRNTMTSYSVGESLLKYKVDLHLCAQRGLKESSREKIYTNTNQIKIVLSYLADNFHQDKVEVIYNPSKVLNFPSGVFLFSDLTPMDHAATFLKNLKAQKHLKEIIVLDKKCHIFLASPVNH